MDQDRNPITRDPAPGLIVMDDQPITVGQINDSLGRTVRRHRTWQHERTDRLEMPIGQTTAGTKRRVISDEQDYLWALEGTCLP
jgi:hypothetical protein